MFSFTALPATMQLSIICKKSGFTHAKTLITKSCLSNKRKDELKERDTYSLPQFIGQQRLNTRLNDEIINSKR